MNTLQRLASSLSGHVPFLTTTIVTLIFGFIAYFMLMARAAKKKKQKPAQAPEKPAAPTEPPVPKTLGKPETSLGALRRSFAQALKMLRKNVPGLNYKYQVPWFLMLGESGSGKTTALGNLDISLPLGKPIHQGVDTREGCNWWFFDKGVVLDVDGDMILQPGSKTSNEKGWSAFIQLLTKNRPERPLDGVVLTISCRDLIGSPERLGERMSRAAEKAKVLYQKLSQLQKNTGICFPVYLMVTQCDVIRGFRAFANEIPLAHREDIFGWSSPYALETGYSQDWAEEATQKIVNDLMEGQIELAADGIQVADADGFFLFPMAFQSVIEPLKVYMNQLFRDSVYHDSFFFRGLYFTGDGTPETIVQPPIPQQPEPKKKSLAELEAEAAEPPPLGIADAEPPGLGEQPSGPPAPQLIPSYWSGQGEEPGSPGTTSQPPQEPANPPTAAPVSQESIPFPFTISDSKEKKPCFLSQLFEKKIFPEYALGRPAGKQFLSMNRTLLVTQILLLLMVLVGGFGLWRGNEILSANSATLTPVMKKTLTDLNDLKYQKKMGEAKERTFFYNSTLNLLEGMTGIGTNSFTTWSMPTSWFDPINGDIKKALTLAYNRIVLKSLYFELQEKTELAIVKAERFEPSPSPERVLVDDIETLPEFVGFRNSVQEFQRIDDAGALYNGLRTSRDLKDLAEVVSFLYGVQLPPGFFSNALFYHQALERADYPVFKPALYRGKVEPRVARLANRLYNRLFLSNELSLHLDRLVRQIQGLQSPQLRTWPTKRILQEFERTVDSISNREHLLTQPEYAWYSRKRFDLGGVFNDVLGTIEKSNFMGEALRKKIEAGGQTAFLDLKKALAEKSTLLTGPVLARGSRFAPIAKKAIDRSGSATAGTSSETRVKNTLRKQGADVVRMALSPDVLALRSMLENFLEQKFINVAVRTKALVTELPTESVLYWDTQRLREATELYELYDQFFREGIQDVPKPLVPLIQKVAMKRLESNMLLLTAHAQTFKPVKSGLTRVSTEQELGPEVNNFKDAVRSLMWMMDIFNDLDFADASWTISHIATTQASRLLKSLDFALDQEGLYEFKGGAFSWWDGQARVSLAAFEVQDPKELEFYLDIQRNRVRHLARDYVEPLVQFLVERTFFDGADYENVIARWQTILLQLQNFEARKTGNSVTTLEKFILFDMDKITPINRCYDPTLIDMNDPAGDFFLQKLFKLRSGIVDRCQLLIGDAVQREYAVISSYFNKNLSGKFPFSTLGLDPVFTEASPESIREFYWLLDQYNRTGLPLLEKSREFGVSGEDALRFLDRMEEVRDFFSGILGQDNSDRPPRYVLDVDFRVNQSSEVGGHQIIDWNFQVGDNTYNFLDPKKPMGWRYGDPITFSVRWAKDSPRQPAGFASPGAAIGERTLTFRYANRWSLINLLKQHRSAPEDFDNLVDTHPHTLKFLVETVPSEDRIITAITEVDPGVAVMDRDRLTKFFIHVGVLTPEKNEEKVLPVFPIRAPQLVPAHVKG